jgi:hypothetical protein
VNSLIYDIRGMIRAEVLAEGVDERGWKLGSLKFKILNFSKICKIRKNQNLLKK